METMKMTSGRSSSQISKDLDLLVMVFAPVILENTRHV
jgi:hypothetical protein